MKIKLKIVNACGVGSFKEIINCPLSRATGQENGERCKQNSECGIEIGVNVRKSGFSKPYVILYTSFNSIDEISLEKNGIFC